MQNRFMEEVNFADTLSHARRVLNSHREWMKKKNSTVSPLGDFKDGVLFVDDVEEQGIGSTPRPVRTSTPLRPHSGKVAPLVEVSLKKGGEDEKEGNGEKENGGSISKDLKKKARRGTVVPVPSLDSPSRGQNVFTSMSSINAWEEDYSNVGDRSSSLLISKSDVIKSEIRLRETLAHIQADGEYDQQQSDLNDSYLVEDNQQQHLSKHLQSTSTPAMATKPTMYTTSQHDLSFGRHSQAKLDSSNNIEQQQQKQQQQQHSRTRDGVTLSTATTTVVKPMSATSRRSSSDLPLTIIVQPVKKRSSINVQPIHVVQPVKPVLPVKVHRPVSQQSSCGDLTIEDAEDWIPPEDVIQSLYQSSDSIGNVTQRDITVTEAASVTQAKYPFIRRADVILEESPEQVLDEKEFDEGKSESVNKNGATISLFSPKPKRKDGFEIIEEDEEINSIDVNSTDRVVHSHLNQDIVTVIQHSTDDSGQRHDSITDIDTKETSMTVAETQQISSSSSWVKKPQPKEILPPLVFEGKNIDREMNEDKDDRKKRKGKKKKKSETKREEEKSKMSESVDENLSDEIGGVASEMEGVASEREGVASEMPLLRVKSVSSLYTPEFKFQKKRERLPPEYSIHAQSSTLPPACPLYGAKQPTQTEVLNKSLVSRTVSPLREMTTPSPTEITGVFADRHDSISREDNESLNYSQRAITTPTSLGTRTGQAGPSELHEEARSGHIRKIQALIMKGYKVDELDDEECTPLMYCILPDGRAQIHCVDFLIRNGANLDHQSTEGFTVLHLASYQGNISLMELLIINGANPDIRDIDGRLPLHWSTNPVSTKPIDLLLKHSVNDVHVVDETDMTLLMWSCYNGNVTVAKYLLDKGADAEEKDAEGKTAMHWASSQCDINCLQLLLTPDMTYFKDHKGCTVIHAAAQSGFIIGVQYILKKRSEAVHDTDKEGRTPLHYAAATDRVDVCYLLLNKGADATCKDKQGLTALEYGKKASNEYVVALFTCHTASMADFTRRERNLRNDSRRLSSRQQDIFEDIDSDIVEESLQSHDYDNISIATTITSSRFADDGECIKEAGTGGYLGYFTCHDYKNVSERDLKDPPCHYYFWIFSGKLYWSRSKDKRNKSSSRVTRLEEGSSLLVKSRPDYSPHDLHQFSFRAWLGEQPIDLLAYSNDSYYMWIVGIKQLIDNNERQQSIISDDVMLNEDKNNSTENNTKETEGLKKGLELM